MPKKAAKVTARVKPALFEEVFVREEDVTDEVSDVLDELKIDPNNLGTEAQEHASLFARWAIFAEEASHYWRRLKRDRDVLLAEKDVEIRKRLEEDEGKVTEARVKAAIEADSDVVEMNDKLLDAERNAGILNAIRQSLTQRREMIAEMMRTERKEWEAS